MDAAEYKHLVLGLIFVKYISDTFAARRAELTTRIANSADEYYFGEASPEELAAELEDRDYYKEANVFWVTEFPFLSRLNHLKTSTLRRRREELKKSDA